MSLTNCELTMVPGPDGPTPVVVADVPAAAAEALADAVARRRDARALGELDAARALEVRGLSDLGDRLRPAPGAEMHVLRLGADDVAVVCDAAERYVAERDVDGYQPAPERARLAALRDVRDSLRDAQAKLMLAGLSFETPA
ncbi:MAG TPA: hypothetical protein VHF51_01090 [Solirubrobacteraceae bacterium]|nr:hypothetical protein [Solirubrobacteraceae bacterium]